ncbi:DUF4013 domain-containing protein [Methanocalculus sp.]|uniref:DUF4013 domain-containing protein n=1 Tax=Methanocalculus sp. TaxID=2004547 RepID=UPI0017ACB9C4|nr:DUF4013 domain-containing protein [Methanocalculus sp.]HIJ07693.1 DUF4013 domain-containing protein [Methanocalculus sp.]
MVAIFPLIYGYTARIYRGGSNPPDLSKPLELLSDGIRLTIVSFIYALLFIGAIIIIGSQSDLLLNLITRSESGYLFSEIGAVFFLIVGVILLYAVVILFSMIGVIRTARSGKIREGFAFSAILDHIGRIGGVSYLSAVIFYTVITFLVSLPAGYMMELSLIGYIPAFFIYAMVTVLHGTSPSSLNPASLIHLLSNFSPGSGIASIAEARFHLFRNKKTTTACHRNLSFILLLAKMPSSLFAS